MFKSVFAKYLSTFMLIIFISFLVVSVVISSTVDNYFESAKSEIIDNSAISAAAYLEGKLKRGNFNDIPSAIISDSEDISSMLLLTHSPSESMTVLITDENGSILLCDGNKSSLIKPDTKIGEKLMKRIRNGRVSESEELKDIFGTAGYMCAVPVRNAEGKTCGSVLVYAEPGMLTELIDAMIKTIIISILLTLVATLIASFIVTERVTKPLKEISIAAKSYAAGKFDVRVPVRGHDEIAEVAVAFNNMAESLNNYDNMRNSFMSNVSHDLRSPMTSISGFIDGILDGVIPPEKHEYYLKIVSGEIKRLSRLVSTLLDLSRIQAGERKFTMTHFDICEMGREIIISFEQKITDKKLDVEFDVDDEKLIVNADRDAIYQIFYNLCDNAVKFASEGGKFRISVKRLKNKKVLVSVFNEGQGISSADLPYVFERFYKSDKSRGLNKSGVGLGLFISKTIVEAHNETIWVDSEYGKSCCFNFTLSQD